MGRTKVILFAVVMALLGAALPITLMAWLSWQAAIHSEQARLHEFANRIIGRAERSVEQATEALQQLSASTLTPCTGAHIRLMQQVAVAAHAVDQIGYFENDVLRCSSWGMSDRPVTRSQPERITPEGVGIKLSITPYVSDGATMMALQYGNYSVLVNPGRFTDVIVDERIHLAIATPEGRVLSESGRAMPDAIRAVLEVRAILDGESSTAEDPHLYALVRRGDWTGIAIAPRQEMLDTMRRDQLWLLPIGVFIGLFIAGLVIHLSRKRLSPLAELQQAVKRREFSVHYQPIIELPSGRCVGAEALVRWRRPDGTTIPPDHFIPLAEDSGLILPITDQVIAQVAREMKHALAADPTAHIAINLCADDIHTGRALDVLSRTLTRSGIAARQIWLEATERGFMDIEPARATLARARALGHPTAIDDFGTGYSSLQYLQGLPMDALKIDKAFVATIGTGAVSGQIIDHIIDMAKSLSLAIVAEGVETRAQADYLAARGVAFAQGWLYSKPLPADAFLRFLENDRKARSA